MYKEWCGNGHRMDKDQPGLLGMAGMDKESSRSLGMNREWTGVLQEWWGSVKFCVFGDTS
jgi:hypothetical protein